MTDMLNAISDSLVARVDAVAPGLVTLWSGSRAQRSAFAWAPGVIITAEQDLPRPEEVPVILPGGATATAQLVGRDNGTNVAVLRVDIAAPEIIDGAARVGALALGLGGSEGRATAALGIVHRVGPAWDSMAGGVIDQLIRLDINLSSSAEGGPVVDTAGRLLGMSTFGPRRRVIAIPSSTVRRAMAAILEGRPMRGWLGLGLEPVALPPSVREEMARNAGLMVMSLAAGGPAEAAGVLQGDILLEIDGAAAPNPRAVARALAARVGEVVGLRLLRGGVPVDLSATVAARPAA